MARQTVGRMNLFMRPNERTYWVDQYALQIPAELPPVTLAEAQLPGLAVLELVLVPIVAVAVWVFVLCMYLDVQILEPSDV
ncbi:hypothetical protein CJEDD_03165 [Corynebacterium jeddahense]|uniref:Uncharacterized protein n=1 Tax=Corynebacterium jeddahense TaxID=1414719 RepID=A0ABY7UL37_9CORY|nr:hypothetical protein CJEDD_03165 [Corynebacterium jeddahense]